MGSAILSRASASGAGHIFNVNGGLMEATLAPRTRPLLERSSRHCISPAVGGNESIQEAEFDY